MKKDSNGIGYVRTKKFLNMKSILPCGPYQCQDSNKESFKETTFMINVPNDLDSSCTSFSSVNSKGQVKMILLVDEIRPIWTNKESNAFLKSSVGLIVYETIDLELDLIDEDASIYVNNSKLRSAFILHSNGVYQLDFSFLSKINEFLIPQFDEDDEQQEEEFESTTIRHLVSSE